MIRAQDQDIQSLVADIRDGKLLLPEMQRRYVWKSTQIRDLVDSLYHEYPSGQLLVWETDDLPASGNRRAAVEGLSTEQRRPQLLLDGQQRLTSLAAVMLGRPLRVRDMSRPIDIAFADAINQLFQSLAGEKHLVVYGSAEMMEARVSAIEQQLRRLVERRFNEVRGASAWKQLVPNDIRSLVEDRIKKHEANKLYEIDQHQSLAAKLMFCQFSDYFKIIQVKTNWPLFDDVFGTEASFAKYSSLAIEARNALKHGRDLTHVDLSAAETGLSWLEECLVKVEPVDESEDEEEQAEVETEGAGVA